MKPNKFSLYKRKMFNLDVNKKPKKLESNTEMSKNLETNRSVIKLDVSK